MDDFEMTDAQLLAYLDGEADEATTRLIEQTPRYQQRAAELAQLQQTLTNNLAVNAPSALDIAQYELGLLSPDEADIVGTYLASHPHAARQLTAWRNFHKQWEPPKQAHANPVQKAKVWLAELLTSRSGGLQPALAGLRGQVEQIYQAGDMQIVLDSDDDPEQRGHNVLAGLIISNQQISGAQARLWSETTSHQVWETAVDEEGNFIFSGLPQDQYTLLLYTDSMEVYIESLKL